MGQQLPHALEGAVERALAAHRIVAVGGATIDGDAKFQAIARCSFRLRQSPQPFVLEDGAVGQHGSRAVLQGEFEDLRHPRMQKRLAAGEVILLHPQRHRFVQEPLDRGQVEKAEAVVVWAAADEAMAAGEVAQGARDLKPELIQVRQGHHGSGCVKYWQRDGHRRTLRP